MSSFLPIPGTLIEFLQDNQPILAWILEIQTARIRVFTIGQREMKLPLSRVLPWTGPAERTTATRQEMLDSLRAHHARRERLLEDIDTMELWALAQGELAQASVHWFASLLFENADPDQLAAVGRKLLQTKTHFKFSPPHFEIYPEETVTKRQEELRRAQERERLVGFGQSFLRALWDRYCRHKNTLPEPDAEQEERIRSLLMSRLTNPDDRDAENLWKTMSQGLPEDPHLPLFLAQTWGLVPKHFNIPLARAQYDWAPTWAEVFAAEIQETKNRVEAMRQPASLQILTIDSATTQDIDDGFAIEHLESGDVLLHVALACPCLCWPFGGPLDRAVQHRFSSLYLPEGTSHMLPEALGTDFFSLCAEKDRPALILTIRLDASGKTQEICPRFSWVHVQKNLTYTGVEEALQQGTDPTLQAALELTRSLRQQRIAENAVIMEQPDPSLQLSGDPEHPQVSVVQHTPTPQAQCIVSEMMILANKALGIWGQTQNLALLYRTQNITLSADAAGVWRDPVDIYRIISSMGPSILETTPRRHATIGATAYAPVTSPLRRYADFLNMAQVIASLRGTSVRSQEELDSLLPTLSARAEAVTQVQRMRPRYWKYEYFRQNAKKRRWTGIVVDAHSGLTTISLPEVQLFLKAPRKIFGDKVRLRQRYEVRLSKADPLTGEARISEAWEE